MRIFPVRLILSEVLCVVRYRLTNTDISAIVIGKKMSPGNPIRNAADKKITIPARSMLITKDDEDWFHQSTSSSDGIVSKKERLDVTWMMRISSFLNRPLI